tara:strand:- start:437 stop:940 length:504 start_codon:yes stop_codon:yes gene_type:complete
MIKLNELIVEDTNLVEIYIKKDMIDTSRVNLEIDEITIKKITNMFKFKQEVNHSDFYKNNLILTYDNTNDNQILYEKKLLNMKENNNNLIIIYNEKRLPSYMYGCDDKIDLKTNYKIKEYKVNNRITLVIKEINNKYILFIQYKHSDNIDMEKTEEILNNLLNRLSK